MRTGAPASPRAAASPAKPAPMMTTCGSVSATRSRAIMLHKGMRKFWQTADADAVTDVTDVVPPRSAWAVPRWRLLAALLLALLNAGVSTALLMQHHGDARASAAIGQVCGTGAESGCETVNKSPYSAVRGVPV